MGSIFNDKALEMVVDEQFNALLSPYIARIEELENLQKSNVYMTKQEVANYLRCSTSTIDNYVKIGLKKSSMSKGKVLFSLSDVDDYVRARRN